MTVEFIKYLVGGSLPVLGLLLLILFSPEKIEKWSVLLWKVIYFLFKSGSKNIIAHDIQGRVNDFSKSLKHEMVNYDPIGISINWIKVDEDQSSFLKENKLVIRMRHHNDQDKNFINASMMFISKAVLPKTKRYLSSSQKESIDLFIGKKLCQREKPSVEEKFFEEYLGQDTTSNEKVMNLLEKYEIVDKVGLFYSVLVQELSFLGEKVFFGANRGEIVKEVNDFITFLKNHADRTIGVDSDTTFAGKYCRCGIVIIAKFIKLQRGKIDPYTRYAETLIASKIENIYLIGSASKENKMFIEKISLEIMEKYGYLEYFSKEYRAKIKIGDERIECDSFLILLRSPEPKRTYDKEYQAKYFINNNIYNIKRTL